MYLLTTHYVHKDIVFSGEANDNDVGWHGASETGMPGSVSVSMCVRTAEPLAPYSQMMNLPCCRV